MTAERNITGESGNFNFVLKRSPGDPRTSETEQFLLKIAEKVEGGFGGGEPLPVENATVTANITEANGTVIRENLPVSAEAGGFYRTSYEFGGAGDYKIVFNATTADNRSFSADFPVNDFPRSGSHVVLDRSACFEFAELWAYSARRFTRRKDAAKKM